MWIHIQPRKKKESGIQKYKSWKEHTDLVQQIRSELNSIDKKIVEIISGLIEAQKVQIKSALTRDNNWVVKLQRKWVNSAALKSANWHQANLIYLYRQRNQLQRTLDKATGQYWPKKIKKIILLLTLILVISLAFALTIYLTPIIMLFLLAYIVLSKKNLMP